MNRKTFLLGFVSGVVVCAVVLCVLTLPVVHRIESERDTLVEDQERADMLIAQLSAAVTAAAEKLDHCRAQRAADAMWQATERTNVCRKGELGANGQPQ